MYKIEKEKLWDDTKSLYYEYLKEDKQMYDVLLKRKFPDMEHYSLISEPFFLNHWVQGINIYLERFAKTRT